MISFNSKKLLKELILKYKKTNLVANISKIKKIGWKPSDTISKILV